VAAGFSDENASPGGPFLMIIPIKPWLDLARAASAPGSSRAPLGRGGVLATAASAEVLTERWPALAEASPALSPHHMHPMEMFHESIMVAEILAAMEPIEGRQIFDGTLGGGGHSEAFLRQGAHVIGCDQDETALRYATQRLEVFGDQFLPVKGNFENIDRILGDLGIDQVEGILFDLGVNSRQLDDASRGFSFRGDGPLDMRMDVSAALSARVVVNEWSEEELIRIFRSYGEEPRARKVARELVQVRAERPLETTLELADLVARVVPKISAKHPATRVFQAIRIAVNRELEVLETVLKKAVKHLAPNGVLAILTFHSLEDRLVKHFMHRRSNRFIDRPEWPEPRVNPDYCLRLPSRRALEPSAEECSRNSRARSAKLRVAIKV